jgi:septal ring factor EnvC (AmiA/AmiB activator)
MPCARSWRVCDPASAALPSRLDLPPSCCWRQSALIPAHATDANEPESSSVASDLEQEQEASRLELRSVADEAKLAAKALAALEDDIAALRADQQELDRRIAETAARRADLDRRITAGEQSMTGLSERQESVRLSLLSRRSVLAEVLAALQRIGRDPPPALLVSPEDALSSVRSAILLGAVVPEIRAETAALAADLKELATLRQAIAAERVSLAAALEQNAAEEQRLANLASEKAALQEESQRRLDRERQRAEALSVRSSELESVIASLAKEIVSLREAAEAARKAEEERQRQLAERLERARAFAAVAVPDKNRIMPAYQFSKLSGTLSHPVKGETVRHFGADDGTGHTLAGEVIAHRSGRDRTRPGRWLDRLCRPVPQLWTGGYHRYRRKPPRGFSRNGTNQGRRRAFRGFRRARGHHGTDEICRFCGFVAGIGASNALH